MRFCLCHARTGFEAADDTHVTIVASFLCRIQWKRRPYFRLSRIVETRSHHADDGSAFPTHYDLAANRIPVSAKAALPQSVTKDRDRLATGLRIVSLQSAALQAGCAEEREEITGYRRAVDAFGFIAVIEQHATRDETSQMLKDLILVLPIGEIRNRHIALRDSLRCVNAFEHHNSI